MDNRQSTVFNTVPIEVFDLICSVLPDYKSLGNLRKASKSTRALVDAIITNPNNVFHIISHLPSKSALKFIQFYRQTKAFDDIRKSYSSGSWNLNPMQIICYALATDDIRTVKTYELRGALTKSSNVLQGKPGNDRCVASLYVLLAACDYKEAKPDSAGIRYAISNMDNFRREVKKNGPSYFSTDSYCNMSKCYLPGLSLDRMPLAYFNMTGANLHKCSLMKVNFMETNLECADLSEANLAGISNLDRTILCMANLTNANLFKANLNYTDMHEANCENANMQEVTLQNSILEFANLQKANLQKADFKRARLDNCNLRGADLRNAKMGTYDSFDVDMGMVVSLEGANLSNANLQGADLQNANLSHANLQGADLRNTNLTGARLDKTQFFAKVTIENISKQLEEIGMHTQGHAQIHELRQAVANDLVAKLKDNADAIKILDIAISNSLFTHRNAISGAVNFIGSIFTADIVPSDSQKILILAKNELLKNQEQLYRKRL